MTLRRPQMTLAMAALLGAACGQDVDFAEGSRDLGSSPFPKGMGALDAASAEAAALTMLGGRVLETDLEDEDGRSLWEITVRRPSGSIVEIDFEVTSGDVYEVESDHPVAGDDLEVLPGFVGLLEAVEIATGIQPGRVLSWELEFDDGEEWEWEVDIETPSGRKVEVEIDARTGYPDPDDDRDDDDRRDDDDDDRDDDDGRDDDDDDRDDDDGRDDDDDDDRDDDDDGRDDDDDDRDDDDRRDDDDDDRRDDDDD